MCCVMPPASPAATRAGADVVEQRGLAVVDVAHHRDHRCAGRLFVLLLGLLFLEEGFRIVQLGSQRLVAHLLDDDHRRLLVELLVDGDHLAQLHQLLDDLGRLHRHLVGQVGHADGFGNMNLLDLLLRRRDEARHAAVAALAAASAARRAPAGACATRRAIGAALQRGALLGRIVGPAGRQLLGLDGLLVTRLGSAGRGRGRSAWGAGLLVDRALDLGGRLGRLFGLLRDEHLLRCVHHLADRLRLVFGGLAALGQIGSALHLFVGDVGGLDDTQRRLDRLGRCSGRGSRRGGFGRCGAGLASPLGLGLGRGGSQCCGGFLGGLARGLGGAGFGGFAVTLLLLFAQAALFGQVFFLATQQLGLGACFFLATLQFGFVDHRCGGFLGSRRVVALDEGALLAHFDLDGARLAARIGLLDLAGRLARQRDLLALRAGGAVRGAQEVEQAFLVRLAERVVRRRLLDAGRLQLLEQRRGRAIELGGELGDGGRSHGLNPCLV